MNQPHRINLNMTVIDCVMALAEGNPGAATTIIDLMSKAKTVDPDSVWQEWGPLLSFDTHRIYGSNIWILYKYVCEGDAVKVFTLLRGVQLGLMTEYELHEIIIREKPYADHEALLTKVQQQLPDFAKA